MTTEAAVLDGRIALRFPYDPAAVYTAKSVVGARWSAKQKLWTYPLDTETCRRLREAFGSRLKVADSLANWYRTELEKENHLIDLAVSDMSREVTLERTPTMAPKMWQAMSQRGYQPLAVKFGSVVDNPIIADQPGLGKTIETLGTLVESGITGRILIVAPKTSLRATWQPEIVKWLDDYQGRIEVDVVDAQTGTKSQRIEVIEWYDKTAQSHIDDGCCPDGLYFLIVNPEMLRAKRTEGKVTYDYPQFGEIAWDAVIVDESHRYLLNANPNSKKCSQWGLGLGKLKSGKRIALSGTPMKGKPRKIWHTLRWLEPGKYPSEWSWSKLYFKTEYSPFSASGEQITEDLRPDREGAFHRELSKIMIRRTKSELRKINSAWAPPEKMYHEVWLPMDPKQKKLYDQMENNTEATMGEQTMTANGVLAIMTRLKQFATSAGELREGEFFPAAPSNKIDWLIDDFIPSRESKIVIASQYSKVIDLVQSELFKAKVDNFKLTGATPDIDRQKMIARFQQPGGPQVFLLTTTAGGVSVTLDAADDLVLLDETWVPDDQEQVEDRIHRTSRTDHQVNIYYVRSLGTLEQDIAEMVELKDESQKRVLDGRRGIEYAKQKFRADV